MIAMRRTGSTIVLMLILAGCTRGVLTEATPAQRLYAADGTYRALLELATAYRETCDARPVAQRVRCGPIVARLQAADRYIERVRARIDGVAPVRTDIRLLEAALAELQATLAVAHAGREEQ